MPENRDACAFHWEPAQGDDLIYVEPRGRELVYGDAVIVQRDQSVRFSAAGEEWWFREPGRYTVGYEQRTEGEILRANIAGESLDGLPMLVCTSIVFFDLKSHTYRYTPLTYVGINQMVRMKPIFEVAIRIADEQRLLSAAEKDKPVFQQVLNAVCAQMIRQIETILMEAGVFDMYTIEAQVREQFANPDWTKEIFGEIKSQVIGREYLGVAIEQLRILDWGIRSGFCPECGAEVGHFDLVCPNRHVLHRCPVCNELIYDGKCLTNGHPVLLCPECGAYVTPDKDTGACPVHGHIPVF